jgi:hypothetical protein
MTLCHCRPINIINCFREHFDEMGGLGYTFEQPTEGRLRFYVFSYPRAW